jgi:hypothetical protein
MPIKVYKPTSPGRRGMSASTFEEITRSKPEKSLLRPLRKRAGRNFRGKITVRHRGGGHKRRYRVIDFKRDKPLRSYSSAVGRSAIGECAVHGHHRSGREHRSWQHQAGQSWPQALDGLPTFSSWFGHGPGVPSAWGWRRTVAHWYAGTQVTVGQAHPRVQDAA